MSEIQLQSKIAQEFSVRFPKKRGQLFHISNERNNKIQAFQARSIGIIPGVSDFLFIELFHPRENGSPAANVIGIEVKEPGSYHKVDHIRQQIEWAKVLIKNGGSWFLVRNVDEVLAIVTGFKSTALTVKEVEGMLDNCKTKTIKF